MIVNCEHLDQICLCNAVIQLCMLLIPQNGNNIFKITRIYQHKASDIIFWLVSPDSTVFTNVIIMSCIDFPYVKSMSSLTWNAAPDNKQSMGLFLH